MPLSSGTRLGPYEIVSPLGAGGMGEVYRARDSRLGREVAVKVLPQHLSQSPEVRARFEREAKTVSSLNHPHICTLFDVGREAETDYLVMELVEGETLAQRLTRGALPAAEALKLGAQVADALDRAHRAGVVHRDLKPGNVMLTKSGAKLMDFGLARATGLAGPAGGSGITQAAMTQSPTIAQPLTAEGTIVGTFQYMSPEQLEGKEADARSDLWGLGCVLYEMVTSKRAFEGKSQASLISSIMKDEPRALSELAPMSPPALDRLVKQCLAKDPDERWQSAGDVRRELEWITGGSSQSGAQAVGARRPAAPRGGLGLFAGAAIAFASLVYAFGPWSAHRPPTPLVRFMLAAPQGTTLDQPAEAELSPDGNVLAFGASDSSGTSHIYVRPLASPEARVLPGTEHCSLPFWSPDSRMIGFFAGGKLRKVPLDGSPPLVLCDAPDPRGGAWSPAGAILFAPNNQGSIVRVSANGGVPTPVTKLDAARHELGHRYPQFLPDGRHFLYVGIGSGEEQSTFAASLDGGAAVEVCRAGSGARFVPPGYLLYLDTGVNSPQRRLLARRFDAAKLRANGDPELVIDDVNANNFGYANVAANDRGTLVVQHWSDAHARLEWRDRRGAAASVAVDDFDGDAAALSPDGRRLAYDGSNPHDLYVLDLASGVSTRLTFENQRVSNTVWSFDGRSIAFSRLFGARGWEIHVKAADGTGPDSLVFHGAGLFNFPQSWSRDGRWLVATSADSSGNFDLWRIPMSGPGVAEIYQRTRAQERNASLSPDGRWVAYAADDDGKPGFYVQSFPNPGAKYQVALPSAAGGGWTERGDALLIGDNRGAVLSVQVSTTDGFRQGATTRLFQLPPGEYFVDTERGEQRFLTATPKDLSSLTRLEVVLGWTQLLEKK
jgi:Tol biopolymer transport system component